MIAKLKASEANAQSIAKKYRKSTSNTELLRVAGRSRDIAEMSQPKLSGELN
jgi:hypothetical protein